MGQAPSGHAMCVLYEAVFTVHVLDPMPWQTDNDVIDSVGPVQDYDITLDL